jgi:hypothetical protein
VDQFKDLPDTVNSARFYAITIPWCCCRVSGDDRIFRDLSGSKANSRSDFPDKGFQVLFWHYNCVPGNPKSMVGFHRPDHPVNQKD